MPKEQVQVASELRSWRDKLLPFMIGGLALLAVLFFLGTFWNYANLQERLSRQEPDIVATMDKLRATTPPPAYQDWYMRVVLEEHAMRSRHRQNAAIIESRVWTRFMGFITGMVMVMAGCIFILGRLDAQFDGSLKSGEHEGVLKTNSPGLVLAVAGTVLIAMALTVPVHIEVNDTPVYLADVSGQATLKTPEALPAPAPLPGAQAGASAASSPTMPPGLADELCKQAGKPPGCMSR
jgi:hypothetical protein